MHLFDTLVNFLSALGSSKDKRKATQFLPTSLDQITKANRYRYDWISRKAISIPVEDAVRKWRTFSAEGVEGDDLKDLVEQETKLGIQALVLTAAVRARTHGGAIIVPILDESRNIEQPLDVETIRKDELIGFRVLDSSEVWGGTIIEDIRSDNYGYPEFYYNSRNLTVKIHHTWVARFDGVPLTKLERQANRGWDDSILDSMVQTFDDLSLALGNMSAMTSEAKITVIKTPKLIDKVGQDNAEAQSKLQRRFELLDQFKSILNMVILDDKETFENHQLNFSGLSDVITGLMTAVSGCVEVPVTRFFGTSAKGLNATGEGDEKEYYDRVASKQTLDYSPRVRFLDEIWVRSYLGNMPDDWESVWNPLFQMSEKEEAETFAIRAGARSTDIQSGVIPPSVGTKQAKENGDYSDIDDELIEAMEEEEQEPDDEDEFTEPVEPPEGEPAVPGEIPEPELEGEEL